jgi:hypothetical protein
MQSVQSSRWFRSLGLALLLSLLASSALAQTTPWDQKAVTTIAMKLERALRDLRFSVRRNPEATKGSHVRRAQFQARETLRLLVSASQRLSSQLQAGEDLDATLPTFRRLQMLRRDAERFGRRANMPTATLDQVVNAQALSDQLAAFYGKAATEEEAAERADDAAAATKPTPAQ